MGSEHPQGSFSDLALVILAESVAAVTHHAKLNESFKSKNSSHWNEPKMNVMHDNKCIPSLVQS